MTSPAQRRRKPLVLDATFHGRPMSLAVFDGVQACDGLLIELNKGIIEVGEIPSLIHALVLQEVRLQFSAYQSKRPQVIRYQGGGSDAKMTINAYESQRHADWSVYLTPPPAVAQPWSIWNPTVVIEVVSASSIRRDYEEKPGEYLAIGVFQYWILDPIKSHLLVKTNTGGLWQDKLYKPGAKVICPLLPRFSFDLRRALNASKKA